MHAHTQHLTRTTHPNALKKEKRCGGGGEKEGRAWGRESGRDITSPVRTTAVMCVVGQRKEGGWDKGSRRWRRRGGFQERGARRTLEMAANSRRCEDVKTKTRAADGVCCFEVQITRKKNLFSCLAMQIHSRC